MPVRSYYNGQACYILPFYGIFVNRRLEDSAKSIPGFRRIFVFPGNVLCPLLSGKHTPAVILPVQIIFPGQFDGTLVAVLLLKIRGKKRYPVLTG